jgi:hypothetical protein
MLVEYSRQRWSYKRKCLLRHVTIVAASSLSVSMRRNACSELQHNRSGRPEVLLLPVIRGCDNRFSFNLCRSLQTHIHWKRPSIAIAKTMYFEAMGCCRIPNDCRSGSYAGLQLSSVLRPAIWYTLQTMQQYRMMCHSDASFKRKCGHDLLF